MRNEMNDKQLMSDALAVGINSTIGKLFPPETRDLKFELALEGLLKRSRDNVESSFQMEVDRYIQDLEVLPDDQPYPDDSGPDLFIALIDKLSREVEFAQTQLDTMLALGRLLGRSNNE